MRNNEPQETPFRVLIVDDAGDVRLGMRLLVESVATEVREAESGERALEVLGQWMPHLVVTDIVMGAVSGIDLLRHIHDQQPEIKVLVVTAYGTEERIDEAFRLGAEDVIAKPFDNEELLASVMECLSPGAERRQRSRAGF